VPTEAPHQGSGQFSGYRLSTFHQLCELGRELHQRHICLTSRLLRQVQAVDQSAVLCRRSRQCIAEILESICERRLEQLQLLSLAVKGGVVCLLRGEQRVQASGQLEQTPCGIKAQITQVLERQRLDGHLKGIDFGDESLQRRRQRLHLLGAKGSNIDSAEHIRQHARQLVADRLEGVEHRHLNVGRKARQCRCITPATETSKGWIVSVLNAELQDLATDAQRAA